MSVELGLEMRAWSGLRQLLAVMLCALLAVPAYSLDKTLPAIPPHDQATAGVYPKTRVWCSSEKILLHFRAVGRLSEKQPWGCANSSSKIALGSGVTYDYDAFGNLLHSTATGIPPGGTTVAPTPNEFLFAGEQFDSDLNLYYNRARYLNVSTGRFWTMDSDEGNSADPLSLHKYLFAEANAVDNSDPSGNEIDEVIGSFSVSATIDAMPAVLRTAIQAVKHALPYSVVVVTPSSGATYEPKSKVKNSAQASVSGWPVGTPIRIAVPPAINPQTMVDDWSSKSAWNPRTWLEFKRTWSDPANNFKRQNAIFDAYGNFEYGATGAAAGFDLGTLQLAADILHGGSNDPINEADIASGFKAIKKGGTLSTKAEQLAP